MRSIKLLIFTLIVVSCEGKIIRESHIITPSRSSIREISLKEGFSGRVNPSEHNSRRTPAVWVQRPNVAPIRPGYSARSSDSWRSQASEATSRRDLQSSQPPRKMIFVSPQRNMREQSSSARTNSRRRHSRRMNHHRNNSGRTQAPRVRRPNVHPIRPRFTTEKPSASFRYRNPKAFARNDFHSSNSQRVQTFVPPPRNIRTKPVTAEDNPRKGHSRRISYHKNNSGRDRAPRVQRPSVHPVRPRFTTEKPSASFRYRNPKAFARSDFQSSSSQRRQTFVSPSRNIRINHNTARTNLRGSYYDRKNSQETNFARTQASRSRRPNVHPTRTEFTNGRPSAASRFRTSKFSFQPKSQSPSAVIRIIPK